MLRDKVVGVFGTFSMPLQRGTISIYIHLLVLEIFCGFKMVTLILLLHCKNTHLKKHLLKTIQIPVKHFI
jgi:hypothetical protein